MCVDRGSFWRVLRQRRRNLAVVLLAFVGVTSAGWVSALQNNEVGDLGRASERADRSPHRIVEYDVFGDSISAGFGVAAHRTWVGAVSFHLFATQPPDVEHRFYNYAIEGQAILTPSFLATDQRNSSLVAHLQNFLRNPTRSTPLWARVYVLTPSVNELVVSDQGISGQDRIDKAIFGVRTAIQQIRNAGVPSSQIVVLPMPPIGLQFAAEFEVSTDVDQTLASMIVGVNEGLADVLDVQSYPTLDGNNNGLAVSEFFDGLYDPATRRGADGLHLDADGHEALAADIDDYFRERP